GGSRKIGQHSLVPPVIIGSTKLKHERQRNLPTIALGCYYQVIEVQQAKRRMSIIFLKQPLLQTTQTELSTPLKCKSAEADDDEGRQKVLPVYTKKQIKQKNALPWHIKSKFSVDITMQKIRKIS
ncbi:5082_t:CDS:2, partial [Ambispora gerdemannii]